MTERAWKLIGVLFLLTALTSYVSTAFTEYELGRSILPLLAFYGVLCLSKKRTSKGVLWTAAIFTAVFAAFLHSIQTSDYVVLIVAIIAIAIATNARKNPSWEWMPTERRL